jgi:hypothetical protein
MLDRESPFSVVRGPLASLILVIGCSATAMAAEAVAQCTERSIGDHAQPIAAQLRCIEIARDSLSLRSVATETIYSEASHYFSEAALTGDVTDARIFKIFVDERERRKPVRGKHSNSVYSAFLLTGHPELAERERIEKNLDVAAIDASKMIPKTGVAVTSARFWTFEQPSGLLVEDAIDLTHGTHIVVYSAPGCGACEVASDALRSDALLSGVFVKRSIWVDVPDASFSSSYFADWDTRHPLFPIHAVFARQNWPQRDIPATPYFFVVKDGNVAARILGWTPQGRAELAAAIAAHM